MAITVTEVSCRVQESWDAVCVGSKVDVLNKNAESPLHLAIRMMHADIVQLLVNYGRLTNASYLVSLSL